MSGFTLSYRDEWSDPIFKNFLEASIWKWMKDAAAWKDMVVNFGGSIVQLKRGQFVTTMGFLAKGFEISEKRARNWVDKMENMGFLGKQTTNKFTIITICNYGENSSYQKTEGEQKVEQGANKGQTKGDNKKEDKEYNKDIDDLRAGDPEKNNQKIQEVHHWIEKLFSNPVPYPTAPIVAWLAWGADFEIDIKPAAEAQKARQPDKPPRSLKWLDEKIAASIQQRKAIMPEVQPRASPSGHAGQATDKQDRILQAILRKQAENETNGSDSVDNRPDG